MSDRSRLILFFLSGIVFLGLYCNACLNMPPWGFYRGPYGDVIARIAVFERHATDVVNAINYDYRAFDTLGEEFILCTAAWGVMLLLRREGEDGENQPAKVPDRSVLSSTIQVVTVPAVLLTSILGFYIGVHGQLTPGGGFQAGVILSTALLLVYVAQNSQAFEHITGHDAVEIIEALGAGSYATIGVLSLALGVPFLTNILPLGETGDVFSSGTIALISACVGVEVTAAFLMVAYTYLQEIIRGEVSDA